MLLSINKMVFTVLSFMHIWCIIFWPTGVGVICTVHIEGELSSLKFKNYLHCFSLLHCLTRSPSILCVSSEQICSNYWVYYLLSFSGYFLLSSLLTYSLFSLNVQVVYCAGDVFSLLGSFEPGCHVLCDLSHMAYCKKIMYDVFSLLGSCEDVRLKCCFDNKLVFLCTSCFDSKIMKNFSTIYIG